MKKLLNLFVLSLIFIVLTVSISSAQNGIVDSMEFQGEGIEMSLSEAIKTVMANSLELKQSQVDLQEAEMYYERSKQAIEGYDYNPAADRSTSVTYLEKQLLILRTEYNYNSVKKEYDAKVNKLRASVEESYFNVLHAQEARKINMENVNFSKELYEKVKKKYDMGLVAKQEVLNSELNLANAQIQLSASENALKNAKMALNVLLNLDVMTELKLTDTLDYRKFKQDSIAEAVMSAFNNRNEVFGVQYAYDSQKLNLEIIQKQYPAHTYKYKEAAFDTERALQTLESVRKNIELDVRSKYLSVLQKQDEISVGKKSVELAQEAYRLSQISFDAGMGLQDDIQRAQIALQKEKLNLSKAILDYNLAVSAFEDSIGTGR